MIKVEDKIEDRIIQGDIYRNVEYLESVEERHGDLYISKIVFPLVIVLTQDCDLAQDYKFRNGHEITQDKFLISVLVAPLYNAEHVMVGEHLSKIGLKMEPINKNKTPGKYLITNDRPRYHYLEFEKNIPIAPSIIDFKHYFSVNVEYLKSIKNKSFVCRVSALYREDISHRFSHFLSRIGLP